MNIFLPSLNITEAVKSLDDKRLNKQILECKHIINVYLGKETVYENHPVVKHYINYPGFVTVYGLTCCEEYAYRKNKNHADNDFFIHYLKVLVNGPEDYDFVPFYAEKSIKDPDNIRTTNPIDVVNLFQKKLTLKWCDDAKNRRPPIWSKRNVPDFVKNYLPKDEYAMSIAYRE